VEDTLRHVKNLLTHGCKGCGSDPVNPGNDVSTGELTVNWIDGGGRCEEGKLCWPYEREFEVALDTGTQSNNTMSSEQFKAVVFEG
jgi:hypothetical protein